MSSSSARKTQSMHGIRDRSLLGAIVTVSDHRRRRRPSFAFAAPFVSTDPWLLSQSASLPTS